MTQQSLGNTVMQTAMIDAHKRRATQPRPKAEDNRHMVELAECGYTVQDLSEELGIDPTTVYKYMNGVEPCPKWTVIAASALKTRKMEAKKQYIINVESKDCRMLEDMLKRMGIPMTAINSGV